MLWQLPKLSGGINPDATNKQRTEKKKQWVGKINNIDYFCMIAQNWPFVDWRGGTTALRLF